MKLVRHGPPGLERPGIVDGDVVRDLTGHVPDIDLSIPFLLEKIAAIQLDNLDRVAPTERLGCPVASVGKFLGIGLNYTDHAIESGMPVPEEPVLFTKAVSALSGPNDPIILPPASTKTDWEVELGIVIGKRASHVSMEQALEYVAGYCVVNDVSEREYQLERGGTWDKGKGCDTFGPVGPWLVTRDEVEDPQKLELWLDVNGVAMQRGSTAQMIFSCAEIVAGLSKYLTLHPGDIITSGTPSGVGMGRSPGVFLREGDRVSLGVSGLGEQSQLVTSCGL